MSADISLERNHRDDRLEFHGYIDFASMNSLELSDFDRAVLADCAGADRKGSDRLLALELLFRLIETAAALPTPSRSAA